jgi:ATP-dependent DNA helicase 2 subunit 2
MQAFKIKDTFNVSYQRLYQCIQHRCVYETGLPDKSEFVKHLSPTLQAPTLTVFPLESLEEVQEKKQIFQDDVQVEAKAIKDSFGDLFDNKASKIGTVDPVRDFNEMIERRDKDLVSDAISQMQELVLNTIQNSFGEELYPKCIEYLEQLRKDASRKRKYLLMIL